MYTVNYKGHYIHENFIDDIVKVQYMYDNTWILYNVKSVRAAKILITTLTKG